MDDLASAYEHQLKQADKRLTPQRKLILRLLTGDCGHLDALGLYERGRQLDPGLSLSTVYRTLRLLKEAGLVREVYVDKGNQRYEIDGHDRHTHLVCRECGHIVEIASEPIIEAVRMAAQAEGFALTAVQVDLVGCCRRCQQPPAVGD